MEKYIQKWLEAGYIDEKLSKILLEDVREGKKKTQQTTANITIYSVGAVLAGIGVASFIMTNTWLAQVFGSDVVKIITSILMVLVCLGSGYYFAFMKKNFISLGNVLIFLSTILIGGTYVLIANAAGYDLVKGPGTITYLIWSLSILPLAFVFKKQSINIFAVVLFIFYALLSNLFDTFQILLPVAFGIIMYIVANCPFIKKDYPEFSKVYKITAIFPLFFSLLYISTAQTALYGALYSCSAMFMFLFLLIIAEFFLSKEKTHLLTIETMILSLICFFAIRLNLTHTIIPDIIWADVIVANILIVTTIASLYLFGSRFQNKELIENANFFLFVYIIVIYSMFGYARLDRTVYFLIGGVGLFGIGIFIEKQKKNIFNLVKKDEVKEIQENNENNENNGEG